MGIAPGGGGAAAQLRWFSTLWALALTVHTVEIQPSALVPVLLVALPALLFPSSVAACGLLLAAAAVMAVSSLPAAANHLVMALVATLALAAAALHALASRRQTGEPFVGRWLDTARTPAGLVLLVMYLCAAFHKLNTAFFDPATSCAGTLLTVMADRHGLGALVPGPGAVQVAAAATVLAEVAVLVLLGVPRWRCWGVLLGMAFHAVLALTGFAHFATFAFALYVLLVARPAFEALAPRWLGLRRIGLCGFAAHVVFGLAAGLLGTGTGELPWPTLLVGTWFVAVGAFMIPLLGAGLATRRAGVPGPRWRLRPAILLLVPLLALGNGVLPYLGSKTVASFSMYSNLHTEEGRSNHLLPGITAAELFGYHRDVVTVVALILPDRIDPRARQHGLAYRPDPGLDAPWTVEPRVVRLPWVELRRTVVGWRAAGVSGIGVSYERAGEQRVVPDAITDPVLAAPLPWWEEHLLAFRAVDSAAGPDHCRW